MSAGLLLVPALVFLLYVGAFYQPMENARNTEVLFVNLDGGELSQAIESAILSSGVYNFKTASLDYATTEVNEARAWGALIIPAGFEDNLRSGNGAEIILLADDSRSYIISRTMQPTIMVLSSRLQEQILQNALDSAASGMDAASRQEAYSAQSLQALSAASSQLKEGQSDLISAESKMSDYGQELTSSNLKLQANLKSSVQAGRALTDGAGQLRDGAGTLSSGLLVLNNGTTQLLTVNSKLNNVLASAYASAQSIPDGVARNQTISLISSAQYLSSAQNSGLQSLDSGTKTAYSGSQKLYSGLGTLTNGLGTLSDGLIRIKQAQLLSTASIADLALNTKTISTLSKDLESGIGQVGSSQSLLADKSSSLSFALSSGSDQLGLGGINLRIVEANYADYGTFFATAFVSLGLFFGAASAYIFCSLSKLRHPTIWAFGFAILQSVILICVYALMSFPMRSGEYSLLAIMLLSSLVFLLMTRALVRIVSPIFEAHHLSLYSPILSLLAVFMISSGGAMWPQHTLQAPFNVFTPFIPMYYSVSATRASALAAVWPSSDLRVLVLSCAFLWILVELADHFRPKIISHFFKNKYSV